MNWIFGGPPALPNGMPPPPICKTCKEPAEMCAHVVCDKCKQIRTKCTCASPSPLPAAKKSALRAAATPAQSATSVPVSESKPKVPDVPATPPACSACAMDWTKCSCPAVWGGREESTRLKLRLSDRVNNMREFLSELAALDGFEQAAKTICEDLSKRGEHFMACEALIAKRRDSGVLITKILESHAAAVTEWLTLCEEHVSNMLHCFDLGTLREKIQAVNTHQKTVSLSSAPPTPPLPALQPLVLVSNGEMHK